MTNAIIFDVNRTGYSIDQVINGSRYGHAMTVGELKEILEDCNDDDVVILGHDNRYTFGTLPSSYEFVCLDEQDQDQCDDDDQCDD